MYLIAILLAHLLMLYLIGLSPVKAVLRRFGSRRHQVWRADWRIHYYLWNMFEKWLLLILLVIIGIGLGWSPQTAGLRSPTNIPFTILFIGSMCLVIGLMVFLARRFLRDPDPELQAHLHQNRNPIFPQTPKERFFFALDCLTAGISEEILFRGFMLAYLTRIFPQIPLWSAILLSACFFGLDHLYQGKSSAVSNGIFGLIYGVFYVLTGSLFPLIIVHALFDLRLLVAGIRDVAPPSPEQQNEQEWIQKGLAFAKEGQHEEALAAFEQAIQLAPEATIAHYEKGLTLSALGRVEEALEAHEQALLLSPNHIQAWCARGTIAFQLERYEEALKAFEQALLLDPHYTIALYWKGRVLAQLERYEEAALAYEQALRRNPDDNDASPGTDLTLSPSLDA